MSGSVITATWRLAPKLEPRCSVWTVMYLCVRNICRYNISIFLTRFNVYDEIIREFIIYSIWKLSYTRLYSQWKVVYMCCCEYLYRVKFYLYSVKCLPLDCKQSWQTLNSVIAVLHKKSYSWANLKVKALWPKETWYFCCWVKKDLFPLITLKVIRKLSYSIYNKIISAYCKVYI